MRYYKIEISGTGVGGKGGRIYSSLSANGSTNPGALNVELDIPVTSAAQPMGKQLVKVWGISLKDIGQASDLNDLPIAVYGGFQKGLPLATSMFNRNQSGLLVRGQIFAAYGNWIGTDQTLEFIIVTATTGNIASTGTQNLPNPNQPNIYLNWKKGTPLQTAIANTLTTAYPTYKQTFSINPKLVYTEDQIGYYGSLEQFSQYVKQISETIINGPNGGSYAGVDITVSDGAFIIKDGSVQSAPTQILFQDMIGQPTWLGPQIIQLKCAMRSDLKVGDYIKMPPSIVISGPTTVFPTNDSASIFQGTFRINAIRHIGNYKQPDAAAWVTTIDCGAIPKPAAPTMGVAVTVTSRRQ